MAHNNTKAFEYTKEIVIAAVSNLTIYPNDALGKDISGLFEEIFNKLVQLEDQAFKLKND